MFGLRPTSLTLAALVPLLWSFAGCAEEEKPPAGPTTCQATPFAVASQRVIFDTWNNRLTYTLEASSGPFETLQIRSYNDGPASLQAAGRYNLYGSNFKDCDLCLLAFAECTDGDCNKVYFADTGALLVSAYGEIGGQLTAELYDVTFREVTIDEDTYESTPVVGGGLFCAHGLRFDLPIEEKLPSPTCVADGSGVLLGDNIADFSLVDCNGTPAPLHTYCGTTKAVRLMLVAGWCSACASLIPGAESQRDLNASRGQETLYLLGEDDQGGRPSQAFCRSYADGHDIPYERMLIDYGNTWGAWEATFTHIYPYLGDSIGLPWNAVLDGRNMQYVYNDEVGPGAMNATIGELLNR